MKIIIVTLANLVILLWNIQAYSKQEVETNLISYAIGLNAGWVVGNGIIARAYSGVHVFQTTFVGQIDKEKNDNYANVSLSYARYLNQKPFSVGSNPIAVKWLIGGEVVYEEENDIPDNRINIGSGVGLDIGAARKEGFILSFDVIYTVSFKGLKKRQFNSLSLEPSVGILYNF